ncbi:hypothetical protein PQR75_35590 [Paraburkholderia fungorum]|uniref:hypothetical protein n=1 Tax=Paraburkholderia fungorum TaxID=134537 RepID=UPI0038BD9A9C
MSGYPYRTLFAWMAALALIWLALCSPWSFAWNGVCAALVVLMTIVAMVIATRRIRERRHATRHMLSAIDTALASLPSDIKRNTPLVIAVGGAPHSERTAREARPGETALEGGVHVEGSLADLFGRDLVRMTDTAIWVRSNDPARLAHLADALRRWRDGQGPDAVAYPIAADRIDSQPDFAVALKRWRGAIAEASRALGYPLPVCVAVYAEEADAAAGDCPWFGVSGGCALRIDTLPALVASRAVHARGNFNRPGTPRTPRCTARCPDALGLRRGAARAYRHPAWRAAVAGYRLRRNRDRRASIPALAIP